MNWKILDLRTCTTLFSTLCPVICVWQNVVFTGLMEGKLTFSVCIYGNQFAPSPAASPWMTSSPSSSWWAFSRVLCNVSEFRESRHSENFKRIFVSLRKVVGNLRKIVWTVVISMFFIINKIKHDFFCWHEISLFVSTLSFAVLTRES